MYAFFLMLLILDALFLLLVVLLQSGKGAGLAAEFGGASSSADTFLGGRQAATLLTKASWVAGGAFMALALILAILSARGREPASILEGQLTPPAQQEVPSPVLDREGTGVQGLDIGEEGSGSEGGEEEGSGEGGGGSPPGGGN